MGRLHQEGFHAFGAPRAVSCMDARLSSGEKQLGALGYAATGASAGRQILPSGGRALPHSLKTRFFVRSRPVKFKRLMCVLDLRFLSVYQIDDAPESLSDNGKNAAQVVLDIVSR